MINTVVVEKRTGRKRNGTILVENGYVRTTTSAGKFGWDLFVFRTQLMTRANESRGTRSRLYRSGWVRLGGYARRLPDGLRHARASAGRPRTRDVGDGARRPDDRFAAGRMGPPRVSPGAPPGWKSPRKTSRARAHIKPNRSPWKSSVNDSARHGACTTGDINDHRTANPQQRQPHGYHGDHCTCRVAALGVRRAAFVPIEAAAMKTHVSTILLLSIP